LLELLAEPHVGLCMWLMRNCGLPSVFAISYFFRRPATLRKIQAFATCLWIMYGVAIGALPVIVANVIVAGAAVYSSLRGAGSTPVVEAVPISGQVERREPDGA
jgi:hypothetical protein